MEIKKLNNADSLKTVAKFAQLKNISRQFAYKLIEFQEVDYTIIDGITFIVMNDKAKNYKRKR